MKFKTVKQRILENQGLDSKKGIAFSLEMLLVVGMLSVLLYLIVGNMVSGGKKLDVSTATVNMNKLTADTKALFRKQGDFAGITSAVLVQNHIVPEDMVAGTGISDMWNNSITTAPVTATNANDSFSFTLPTVPKEVCSTFVTAVQGSYYRISVAGTDVKTPSKPLSAVTLGTQCDSAASVPVVLYAGRN
jgi:type II secretory pathway pseudopilin PulG